MRMFEVEMLAAEFICSVKQSSAKSRTSAEKRDAEIAHGKIVFE